MEMMDLQEIERRKEVLRKQREQEESQVRSVSAYMNVGEKQMLMAGDLQESLHSSPIMENAIKLPVITDIQKPTKEMIEAASAEAMVNMPATTVKQNRRVQRSQVKFERQQELHKKQLLYAKKAAKRKKKNHEPIQKPFKTMMELMYEDSGKLGDEKLVRNYDQIKDYFADFDGYEAQFQELKKKRKEAGDLTPEQQEKMYRVEAKLLTMRDMKTYYEIHEALMSNKYYNLLPREEMQKLEYGELRMRLKKLYTPHTHRDEEGNEVQEERNEELIDYYQNLIRLKELNMDFSDWKSVYGRSDQYYEKIKIREEGRKDTRDPREELKKMAKGYRRFMKTINDEESILTEDQKIERLHNMFSVFGKDIEAFENRAGELSEAVKDLINAYKKNQKDYGDLISRRAQEEGAQKEKAEDGGEDGVDDNEEEKLEKRSEPSAGIVLTDDQREGMRLVQSWLLRHANDTSTWDAIGSLGMNKQSQSSFVYHLLEAPPEQQLMAFYLVEHKKADKAMNIDFHEALYNYTPDVNVFKKNTSWGKLSRAVRKAMDAGGVMQRYAELNMEIVASLEKVRKDQDPPGEGQQENSQEKKRENVFQAMVNVGKMLRLLYNNAGLDPDMPPDMAQDESVRSKLQAGMQQLAQLARRMKEIGLSDEERAALKARKEGAPGEDGDEGEDYEYEKKDVHGDNFEKLDLFSEYAENIMEFDDVMVGLDKYGEAITMTASYAGTVYGLSGALSVIGLASSIFGAYRLGNQDGEGLTSADKVAQWLDVGSDIVGGIADTMISGGYIAQTLEEIAEEAAETAEEVSENVSGISEWLGDISENNWSNWSSVSTATKVITVAGAAVAVVGAVKTVASGIQLGRAVSNAKDVTLAKEKLEKKDKAKLSSDEKKQERFLRQRERAVEQEKTSATIGMVTGVLTIVSGLTMSTGFLSPIGGIAGLIGAGLSLGYERLVGKKKRHANRKKAVDEFLDMNNAVEIILREHPNREKLKKMKPEKLRDKIRQEMMGEMGFATYKECFRHICEQNAEMLHRKYFREWDKLSEDDKKMYEAAIRSLGLKVERADPNDPDSEDQPSEEDMIDKMMG